MNDKNEENTQDNGGKPCLYCYGNFVQFDDEFRCPICGGSGIVNEERVRNENRS